MTALIAPRLPDVPGVPDVPRIHDLFVSVPEFTATVGTSGHIALSASFEQVLPVRAPDILEVNRVSIDWASVGTTGHLSSALQPPITYEGSGRAMSRPIRARMWKFSIPVLHPATQRPLADLQRLVAGLHTKSRHHYMWVLHDRDEGSAPHVQGALKLSDSRTREQVSSMLGLPARSLQPLVDRAGQHGAFERYCRYLLHESPEARADGKALYVDGDAHANFDFREMIDRYFGLGPAVPVLSVEQIRQRVYLGMMTLDDVESRHLSIYLKNIPMLRTMYHEGEMQRALRARAAEDAVRLQEEEQPLQAENEQRESLHALGLTEDEVSFALESGLSGEEFLLHRQAEDEAHNRAVQQAHDDQVAAAERVRAEQESPEYRERAAQVADEQRRQLMIAWLAFYCEVQGDSAARESAVLAAAVSEGFTSRQYARGDVLSLRDASAFYEDRYDLSDRLTESEKETELEQELELFRKSLASVALRVSSSEYHAAEGSDSAFETALRLRSRYRGWSDLVSLPAPDGNLTKKQRNLLFNAA